MLMLHYGKDRLEDLSMDMIDDQHYVTILKEEKWWVNFIKELIDVKHGTKMLPEFNKEDINSLLEFACTS